MLQPLVSLLFASVAALGWSGRQPRVVAAEEDVYLAFADTGAVRVVRSTDGGATFGAPVAIPIAGTLEVGARRGPRIAVTRRAVIVASIVGTRGGGADGDVVVHRSLDRGATWSRPTVVNDVPGAAREGLHALAASPGGVVALAWLDLRATGATVHAAISRDHGATWSRDLLVHASPSGTVCECCHPSIAVDDAGRIAVMFRNSLAGERDMYLVRLDGAGRAGAAAKLGTGSWRLDACPMDGGDLNLTAGEVTAVWRREHALFLSTAAAPETPLGTGRHPAVARRGARRDLAWMDADQIVLRQDGAAPVRLGRGESPSLAALPDHTIVVWEDRGKVALRRVPRAATPVR